MVVKMFLKHSCGEIIRIFKVKKKDVCIISDYSMTSELGVAVYYEWGQNKDGGVVDSVVFICPKCGKIIMNACDYPELKHFVGYLGSDSLPFKRIGDIVVCK